MFLFKICQNLLKISVYFYLPPAAEGLGQEVIKRLPYMCVSVHASVCHIFISLNISIIYKDILTKFGGNVHVFENISM